MLIGQTIDGFNVAMFMLFCIRHPESTFGKFLNYPLMVHIGYISYSIYIWQTYFLHLENHTILGRIPYSFLAIILAAELSYRFVERGSNRLCRRLFIS